MCLAPEDRHRVLSDQTWAHMVQEVLRGAGLAWPRLQARWAAPALPGLGAGVLAGAVDRHRVVGEWERVVAGAAGRLGRSGNGEDASVGQAAADVMTAAAWRLDLSPDGWRVAAAELFDAAARQPRSRPVRGHSVAGLQPGRKRPSRDRRAAG